MVALRQEITDRVSALDPNGMQSKRFKLRTREEQGAGTIDEAQMRPRLFELGTGVRDRNALFGAEDHVDVYHIPLRILYPLNSGTSWDAALHDDADAIRTDLINNAPSITGVHVRYINDSVETTIAPVGDDQKRQLLTLPILAWIEVKP
jgi:hypothetical protein|tara:strand:- start:1372 stop:1818 length:447 start_codon:yes stop_codon:yes gene_type:complete